MDNAEKNSERLEGAGDVNDASTEEEVETKPQSTCLFSLTYANVLLCQCVVTVNLCITTLIVFDMIFGILLIVQLTTFIRHE